MIVFLKMAWFLFIAFFPLWFGLIGGSYLLIKERLMKMITINYKGFYIEYNVYGDCEWSVQYCGDDFIFSTEVEAREFIDEVTV